MVTQEKEYGTRFSLDTSEECDRICEIRLKVQAVEYNYGDATRAVRKHVAEDSMSKTDSYHNYIVVSPPGTTDKEQFSEVRYRASTLKRC